MVAVSITSVLSPTWPRRAAAVGNERLPKLPSFLPVDLHRHLESVPFYRL